MLGYATLGLIRRYHVVEWKRLFLVGALYGWIGEGALVTTMYGTTMGMWATVSFTGLAWHAMLTGLFGWLFLNRAMRGDVPMRRFVLGAFSAGLCWGLWALNWGFEGHGWDVSSRAFFVHAWVYALPLPLAYFVMSRLEGVSFYLSRIEWGALWVFFGGIYLFWNFTTMIFPYSLILPALLFLTITALKSSCGENSVSHPEALWGSGPYSFFRSLVVLLMPMTASAIYFLGYNTLGQSHTNWIVFLVTMPVGYGLYLYALFAAFRMRTTAIATADNAHPAEL